MEIKVLGPGCVECDEVAKVMAEAISASGITATIEIVADFQQIAKHVIFSPPALMVDGRIKCVGKVPSKEEALAWITK